jgi:hypothetical protein
MAWHSRMFCAGVTVVPYFRERGFAVPTIGFMALVIPEVLTESCATRQALERFASKWRVLVIYALLDGPQRHASPQEPRERFADNPASSRAADHIPGGSPGADPEALLWAVLCLAPDPGISIPELVAGTGMSRRWISYRLEELAAVRRAVQVARGLWRAVTTDGDDNE